MGNLHTWREYAGDCVYENDTLSRVLIDGGYITFEGAARQPLYHYYAKDYLGNNRAVADEAGRIEEINHYYPFGGLMGDSRSTATQPYKYIGKELDRTHGLDWYDHGARYYDPMTGRWNVVDAMAEKYCPWSPYASCGDNPALFYDIDGKDWKDILGNVISELGKIKVFIFYSDDFAEQAKVQYENAIKEYGEGSVALSNTKSIKGFSEDWKNMKGTDISSVMVMTHGKNQSINIGDNKHDIQFTSTGNGLLNISFLPAPNIQDLPQPSGNISNAILYVNCCHSADEQPTEHEGQGRLIGTRHPVSYVFAQCFNFKYVRGTAGAVNYYYIHNLVFPWSDKYMKPYPKNGKWKWYKRKKNY